MPYYENTLKEIQEYYPTAREWEVSEEHEVLLVRMTTLDMVRGIAGDLEIDGNTYALERVFPVVYPGTDTAILIAKFVLVDA